MSLIVTTGLTKVYPLEKQSITGIDDVSIKIDRGEFVSIVGHSGSGKTTLLSIIGGIIRPTSGTVLFDKTDIFALDDRRLSEYRNKNVGFMFQFSSLLPILTAKENLLMPSLFSSKNPDNLSEKAEGYLAMVGLKDKINAYPSQLSGGQQRRVAIARAFMNDPDIILADEPTGDLDEETERQMMEFFTVMNKERGITFIIVTHNTDLAGQTKRRLSMSAGVLTEL